MITWTITSMESQPTTGIVLLANWQCLGEQDGFTFSICGSSSFPDPEEGYIPYPDLTEDEVLNWVWTVGGVDKDITELSVDNGLQLQINPPLVEQPLPWEN